MTIRRLLQYSSVPPEEVVRLRIAYQKSLHALHLVDRNDPVSEIVAKKVIQIVSTDADLQNCGQTTWIWLVCSAVCFSKSR